MGSPMRLMTKALRCASPVKRLPTLLPPCASSPWPLETRRSISVASAGWLETRSRPLAFSYQRKAGMPSLLPCRMPAWLAEVCEGGGHSHSARW